MNEWSREAKVREGVVEELVLDGVKGFGKVEKEVCVFVFVFVVKDGLYCVKVVMWASAFYVACLVGVYQLWEVCFDFVVEAV